MRDPRFVIEHADDPEYSLVTRSRDGQMLFLANKLSKMKQGTRLGSPHRRGPQRQLSLHRLCGTRREQHPPLDQRSAEDVNRGRKSSKFKQDCTICHSCRWTRSDFSVSP